MVEYDIWPGEGGVCERLVADKIDWLESMWNRQETTGNEQSGAFAIHDSGTHTSSISSGGEMHIDYSQKQDSINNALEMDNSEYEHIGSIHTHPNSEGVMNMVMSPRDFNSHILALQDVEGYDSSMVLTENDGNIVIFGVVSDRDTDGLWKYQNEVSKYYDGISEGGLGSQQIYIKIIEMTDMILEFSESCRYKIG